MTDFLMLAFVFLIAGVVAVPIATRLGLGSVLGYLVAGIAISPILAWLGVDVISIQHFAEFGVVMMLFLVGLELEPKMLWAMRQRLFGLGGLQVTLTALLIMAAAMALGQPFTVSLAIGLVLAMSSTAIVLQTLNEKGLMGGDGGRASFSVLLFQDIAFIPILALLPFLAMPELAEYASDALNGAGEGAEYHGEDHHGEDHHGDDHGSGLSLVEGLPGWQAGLITLAAIGAVLLIGAYLTRPLFHFITKIRMRELIIAAALMIVIGIALLMSLVGLSPALGTFVAGVVLANSEYRHELEADIDPFRGLLLGLFFMTVGASINFALLFDQFALLIALSLGLIVIKALVLYGLAHIFKIGGSDRWLVTLGLAQAGEFGFVLLSFTLANNIIPAEVHGQLLLIVAISMLVTPLLFIIHDKLIAKHFSTEQAREDDDIDEHNEIIIAGGGRVGGLVDRILTAGGYTTTVVDYSSKQLETMRTFGIKVYFGDATRPDLLTAAGIEKAKVLIIAIDGKEQITELVRYAVKNYPHVHVIARACDRPHVYDLWQAGCRDIIRETYDSTMRMGRSAFEALGQDKDTAQDMVDAFEAMDRKAIVQLANHYDPATPIEQNAAYVSQVLEILGPWREELSREMNEIRARNGK